MKWVQKKKRIFGWRRQETEGGLRTPTTIGGTTMAFPSARDYFVISTQQRGGHHHRRKGIWHGGGNPSVPWGGGEGTSHRALPPPGQHRHDHDEDDDCWRWRDGITAKGWGLVKQLLHLPVLHTHSFTQYIFFWCCRRTDDEICEKCRKGINKWEKLSQAKPRPKNDAIDQTVIERRREFKQQQQQS